MERRNETRTRVRADRNPASVRPQRGPTRQPRCNPRYSTQVSNATVPARPAGAVVSELPRRGPPHSGFAGGIYRMKPACSWLTMAPAGKPARWPSPRLGLLWNDEGETLGTGPHDNRRALQGRGSNHACNPSRAAAPTMNYERHESHESGRYQLFLCFISFLLFLPFFALVSIMTQFRRRTGARRGNRGRTSLPFPTPRSHPTATARPHSPGVQAIDTFGVKRLRAYVHLLPPLPFPISVKWSRVDPHIRPCP